MVEFLYSLFVWPFQAYIEILNLLFYKVFDSAGISIIVSAFFLNIILMPFYSIKVAPILEDTSWKNLKQKNIKFLFSIAKPYVFIFFYISLFIASYIFFDNVYFEDVPRLGEELDLSKPDSLLGINLFPVIMLIFAFIAIIIIPLIKNKKVTPQSMLFIALFFIFFMILYNKDAMFSLFWAAISIFLCLKNTIDSMKHSSKYYRGIILLACLAAIIAILFRSRVLELTYSLALSVIILAVILITLFIKSIQRFFEGPIFYSAESHSLSVFRLSCIVTFLLSGFVIPLLLFSSSPTEFTSIGKMISQTIFQSLSICFVATFFYWEFSSRLIRRFLLVLMPVIVVIFLISCFVFSGDYGIITSNFVFEEWKGNARMTELVESIVTVLASVLIVCGFIWFKKTQWLKNAFMVIAVSLVIISGINSFFIIRELNLVKNQQTITAENDTQVFTFSKTGENIFVLFLDRATGFSVPDAFKLDPTLEKSLDGFTWYSNTITFGDYTIVGYPAMMGGYEYRPLELNKRLNQSLKDKVNEAIKVLPKIFGDAGYNVMVTDPTYADLQGTPNTHIFDGMKNVSSRNIKGIFRNRYDATQNSQEREFYNTFYYDITMRFSFFRLLPPIVRPLFYYNGKWFKNFGASSYIDLVELFPNLLYLEDLCNITQDGNTFNIMMNETVHREGAHSRNLELVSEPIIFSDEEIEEFGSVGNVEHTYTFSAALSAVGKWCEWLKQEGIYDNTKIIVVSDHGRSFDGDILHSSIAERRNPLLMVKDFYSRGALVTSNEFMTNADMPTIATSSLTASLGKVINPFTGNEISSAAKNEKVLIVDGPWQPKNHKTDNFTIDTIWELKNQNIFEKENWVKAEMLE